MPFVKEYLVDVLNAHNTVLHVFPIVVDEHDIASKHEKCLQEALRTAIYMQLVPEAEIAGLRARACRQARAAGSGQRRPADPAADAGHGRIPRPSLAGHARRSIGRLSIGQDVFSLKP